MGKVEMKDQNLVRMCFSNTCGIYVQSPIASSPQLLTEDTRLQTVFIHFTASQTQVVSQTPEKSCFYRNSPHAISCADDAAAIAIHFNRMPTRGRKRWLGYLM